MLKKFIAAIAAISVVSVSAQAGEYVTTPAVAEGDVRTYDRGEVIVTRETEAAIIALYGSNAYYGRPSFIIEVTNKSDSSIDFGPENLAVRVAAERKPTIVYTKADLDKQAQERAGWAMLASALAASSAGYSSYSSNTFVPGVGTITSRGSFYNNYAAQAEQRAMMAQVQDGLAQRMADAANSALQITTVPPGASYGGRVVYSKPKIKGKLPAKAELSVTIGGVTELFELEVKK